MIRWIAILLPAVFIVVFFLATREDRPAAPSANSHSGDNRSASIRSHASVMSQRSPARAKNDTPQTQPDPAPRPAPDFEFPDIDTHPLLSSDYAQYDTNTLNQLIVAGDATAMQVLAIRFVADRRNGKSVSRAEQLMKNAAVYGATHYPFQFLAREASRELRRAAEGEISMDEHRRRDAVRETLAYAELAGMRGNTELRDAMRRALASRYGIEPSHEEQVDIESRARGLYAEMQGRRSQLGLGAFPEPPE